MRRLVLALALAAAPTVSLAQNIECDYGDREVDGVDFVGNKRFSDSDLEEAIVTTPTSWMRRALGVPLGAKRCVDTLEVERDVLRLRIYYRLRGYYNATVRDSIAVLSTKTVKVRFMIVEGPPTITDSVLVLGLDSVNKGAALLKTFYKFKGGPFNRVALQAAIDTAVLRLIDNGYPYAQAPLTNFTVDSAAHRASIELTFFQRFLGESASLPVNRAKIASIDIAATPGPDSGNVTPETVRKLLFIEPGKVYSQQDVFASQRELYQLELARHVDIDLLPDSAQPNDTTVAMKVRYTEAAPHGLRVGGGWATLDCLRVQARYTDRDLFGGAERLDLNFRLSHIWLCPANVKDDPSSQGLNYYLSGTLRLPTLFGPRNQPSVTLFSERTSEYKAYLRITPIGSAIALTRDLAPRGLRSGLPLTVSARVEYGRTEAEPAAFCQLFNLCSTADIEQLTQNSLLTVIGGSLSHDRTDQLLNASAGEFQRVEARWGKSAADTGKPSTWTRLLGDAAIYRTFGSSVLAARLQIAGLFKPWTFFDPATEFVPAEERLYAGGPNSVRGYGQNLLGPLVYLVNNIDSSQTVGGNKIYQVSPTSTVTQYSATGGNTQFVATVEWRLTMPKPAQALQFAAFVDAGYVWNRGSVTDSGQVVTVKLDDIKITPGIGFRYLSAVGPIRVDFAYNPYGTSVGPAYLQDVNVLRCVSPGNTFDRGIPPPGETCPVSYRPQQSNGFFQRLTFNFSIGQAF